MKRAKFEEFERHLAALSEKDAVRKLLRIAQTPKKKRKIVQDFFDVRMSKMCVSVRLNGHFQITPHENLKNQKVFFLKTLMTEIVFTLRRNVNFHS